MIRTVLTTLAAVGLLMNAPLASADEATPICSVLNQNPGPFPGVMAIQIEDGRYGRYGVAFWAPNNAKDPLGQGAWDFYGACTILPEEILECIKTSQPTCHL